jgi:hypothetical protein
MDALEPFVADQSALTIVGQAVMGQEWSQRLKSDIEDETPAPRSGGCAFILQVTEWPVPRGPD